LTDILKNPVYSTSIGLILYGQKITEEEIIDFAFMREKGLVNRAFKWIRNNF
jgi:cell division ATPase FtsA